MALERLPRRLAAVLYADVVGFSRLTGADEDGTFRRLQSCRELFNTEIEQHNGRLIDYAGDSVLALFDSAVDALLCAGILQTILCKQVSHDGQNANLSYRIGLNLGDIINDGDNVYGDGVNVAARLEGISPAGGICVSASLRDAVGDRLPFNFDDLGYQNLKNIDHPVHAYIAHPVSEKLQVEQTRRSPDNKKNRIIKKQYYYVAWILVLISISAVLWQTLPKLKTELSTSDNTSHSATQLPSIVVLPFKNISGKTSDEYFADGITEDIITDLSRLSRLLVFASNTSYQYKDVPVIPQEIGAKLGANYVLDGSIQKAGDRVRISAKLVDTKNGFNVWAERYDRDQNDLFDIQDDVTNSIINALEIRLTTQEQKLLSKKTYDNLDAYDVFLQGLKKAQESTKQANTKAQELYKQAIKLDPTSARAYGALAIAIAYGYFSGWSESPVEDLNYALMMAKKAVELDSTLPMAYWALGFVHLHRKDLSMALSAAEKAVNIAPSYADGYGLLSLINVNLGNYKLAIDQTKKGMKLNPYYTWQYSYNLGRAYYSLGEYTEAVNALRDALTRNENANNARIYLIASLIQQGLYDDAEWEVEKIKVNNPHLSITGLSNALYFHDQEVKNALLDDLRKAGFPE